MRGWAKNENMMIAGLTCITVLRELKDQAAFRGDYSFWTSWCHKNQCWECMFVLWIYFILSWNQMLQYTTGTSPSDAQAVHVAFPLSHYNLHKFMQGTKVYLCVCVTTCIQMCEWVCLFYYPMKWCGRWFYYLLLNPCLSLQRNFTTALNVILWNWRFSGLTIDFVFTWLTW